MNRIERLLTAYPRNVLAIKARKEYLSAPRGSNGEKERRSPFTHEAPQERAVMRFEADRELKRLTALTEPIRDYLRHATPLEYNIIDHRYWQGEDWNAIANRLKLSPAYCRDDLRQKILKKVESFFTKPIDF